VEGDTKGHEEGIREQKIAKDAKKDLGNRREGEKEEPRKGRKEGNRQDAKAPRKRCVARPPVAVARRKGLEQRNSLGQDPAYVSRGGVSG
jgi:hypothetical protein